MVALPWRRAALGGLAVLLLAGTALVRWDIAQRREAFATDARIAHRLLSQRAVELEAVLATVALLDAPEARRLPALHPALLRVGRVPLEGGAAPGPQLRADTLAQGRVQLVQDGPAARHTVDIDLRRLVPEGAWPLAADGPVRAELRLGATRFVLHPGAAEGHAPAGLTAGFVATKALDAAALRLELHLQRATGPAEWPWARLALLALALAAAAAALAALAQQRERRRRAEELLRLDRLGRLNALGELAAGLAHELNQPLAAALAQAQAARRRLADIEAPPDDPERAAADEALAQAAAQTRRAADIVRRLRDSLEPAPAGQPAADAVDLAALLREALHLHEPALRAAGVVVSGPTGTAPPVHADRVALQQIVHNLLSNALAALQGVPAGSRRLSLALEADTTELRVRIADSGPGIAPALLPRLFHPFVSGREGGLGLGLTLSERLAQAQGGRLEARNRGSAEGGGAEFTLGLPRQGPRAQDRTP